MLDLHAARVRWVIAFALIAILAITRVAMTHRVFSPTYDEPLHTISGYEYLVEHRYTTDIEHPPIARAVLALPFAWNAAPGAAAPSPAQTWVDRGNALFDDHGHYMRGVTKARAGNLLFLLLGIAGAAGWAYGRLGAGGALLAAALFSALPPVLAHAGLATTDMSGTAALALALWALDRWLVTRSWKATATLAFAIALGLLTKFSFPMFFGAAAVIVCVAGRKLPLRKALAACAITALAVWAAYFFSFGTMAAAHETAPLIADSPGGSRAIVDSVRLPAPLFVLGLLQVRHDDHVGRNAFLLGQHSQHGWWYYFPVVLGVKTPVPFLLLAAAGVWAVMRARANRAVALVAAAILAIGMTSHINVGVRHILPIFVPLSLLAAAGAVMLWHRARWIPVVLVAWLATDGVLAHPDYLPWMNAFAGSHPERVLSDSNIDWGQDLVRLARECRRRNVDDLGALVFMRADPARLGLPKLHHIAPLEPSRGWIAISETEIALWDGYNPKAYRWLLDRPDFIRVGKSIRLYRVQ